MIIKESKTTSSSAIPPEQVNELLPRHFDTAERGWELEGCSFPSSPGLVKMLSGNIADVVNIIEEAEPDFLDHTM